MCILCIASRWSRHIAAMVMPMVTLWALSQFLPQGFRLEINSPKLACVGVLFVSLSWFELVMPRLSAWRARRTAAQKDRKRVEAQEAAKRRKKATRRCRNCFTAYKDQTPGSGRFMCTFCGHVSKRPVLDLPVGASQSRSSFSLPGSAVEFLTGSGIFSVTGSPKYWYDRASFVRPNWGSGRSWIGVGPWIDGASWGMSTSWFGGSWPGSALYFGNTGFGWPGSAGALLGDGVFGGERWFAGDSYSGVVCFVLRVFSQLLVFAVWIWRKLSRAEYVEEHGIDEDHEEFHAEGVVGGSFFEAKDKKARRKAEEKRLARLEKEHQEAEEKKQRDEVTRLVEERRRQRVKKLGLNETIAANTGKDIQAERKSERRQEKFRDTEKVPSAKEKIINHDTEELTRKTNPAAAKITKPVKNKVVKVKEENAKSASTFFSRWSAFKSKGSGKSKLFSRSRDAAVASRDSANLLTDLSAPSKSCKTTVLNNSSSPSASSSSMKLSEPCTNVSGSAWTQTPWVKVVCHGTLEASSSTSHTDILHSPHGKANMDENVVNRNSSLDESVSSFMGHTSQQQPETASTFGSVQDHYFISGERSQPTDLLACQYTESTISNIGSNDHRNAIANPFSVCSSGSSFSQSLQSSMSSMSSDMLEISTTNSLASAAIPPLASGFAGKQTHDSLFVRPTQSSAVMMCETGTAGKQTHNPCFVRPTQSLAVMLCETATSSLLPSNIECLPPSESLERCSSCQIWEPRYTVSNNNSGGLMPQEEWHHNSSIYPSQINTLPVDASFQERDDFYQQTNFEPEFYLPSSLFSFEESDSRECYCEDRLLRKKNCLEFGGLDQSACTWEDLDVHYKVPPEFVDCITHSLMLDPVITADGHSYERSAIEDWLKSHDTSPKTGEVLPPPPGGKGVDKTLRPNHILRCQIIEFRERLMRRLGTADGLNTSVPGTENDGFIRSSFQSLPNNLFPVQPVWSRDVFGA